jgi:hypothetical protein
VARLRSVAASQEGRGRLPTLVAINGPNFMAPPLKAAAASGSTGAVSH